MCLDPERVWLGASCVPGEHGVLEARGIMVRCMAMSLVADVMPQDCPGRSKLLWVTPKSAVTFVTNCHKLSRCLDSNSGSMSVLVYAM